MKKIYFLILFIISSIGVEAQDWNWDWATQVTMKRAGFYLEPYSTDLMDNVYGQTMYMDSIFFPDTSFHHILGQYASCKAFGIYSSEGEFLKSIDLYPGSSGNIWQSGIVSDPEGNIYIAAEFQEDAHLQDSVITHPGWLSGFIPDILLVKLDPACKIKWIRTIYGTTQGTLTGIRSSGDGSVYLATSHYGYPTSTEYTVFFGQDSTSFSSTQISLSKLDPEGNLLWRKEINTTGPGVNPVSLFVSGDSLVTLWGNGYMDLVIGGDTIRNPETPPPYIDHTWLVTYRQDGTLGKAEFIAPRIWITSLEMNPEGDIFFGGMVADTLVWGNNTIISEGDTIISILGRMTPDFQPVWFSLGKTVDGTGQVQMNFDIALDHDSLLFTSSCSKHFIFNDSLWFPGDRPEGMTGMFDPQGNLKQYIFTENDFGLQSYYIMKDNCDRILIGGSHRGKSIFGTDTVSSNFMYNYDGFMACIRRWEPPALFDYQDTTGCGMITLKGPQGYETYYWAGGTPGNPELTVSASGTYYLTVSDGRHCFITDSVAVHIVHQPQVNIGTDTVIHRSDTLTLSLPEGFDSYLWSNGDTLPVTKIPGTGMGLGLYTIWGEVTLGPCVARDSLLLTVINNPGVEERPGAELRIHPNPASTYCEVELIRGANRIEIRDIRGKLIYSDDLRPDWRDARIDIRGWGAGVYIVCLKGPGRIAWQKLTVL